MKTEHGFTLIEMLVAIIIIAISALAFLTFSLSGMKQRTDMKRQITAHTMAVDVAERLQKLTSSNTLIKPDGGAAIRVGYDAASGNYLLKKCNSGAPAVDLGSDQAGMTSLTNPLGINALYLYDQNTSTPLRTAAANANIHHPNDNDIANWSVVSNTVAPIRTIDGTTFYAVWTVAYLPCTTTTEDLAKIFITVYWVEPEPVDSAPSAVVAKIASGEYRLKTVSVVAEKAYKIETKAGGS